MTKPIARDPIYRRRVFDAEIIELCVRWYKQGKTVDFLLRRDRGIAAAQAFFRKALATNLNRWPRKVTLDGHVPSHRALRLLRREDPKWRNVEVRTCKYLNNIVEQDHRAIKRRCASMAGFKSFGNAAHYHCRNRAGAPHS
jgi:transposase-like protein